MKRTNFVTFSKSAAGYMAKMLGFRLGPGKKDQAIMRTKHQAKCECCRTPITTDTVGNFTKGRGKYKVDVYCENFVCLAQYIGLEKV